MEDRLLTPKQAGRKFGLTGRTIIRYSEEGRLKVASRTPGGHARFSEREVDQLCRENARKNLGSRSEATVSITPSGTTPQSDASAGKVWTPATTSKLPGGSPRSSCAELE